VDVRDWPPNSAPRLYVATNRSPVALPAEYMGRSAEAGFYGPKVVLLPGRAARVSEEARA